jgi:beta-lactamase superfamily II metal-dependent hydrolase
MLKRLLLPLLLISLLLTACDNTGGGSITPPPPPAGRAEMSVVFLDVGQGESILIKSPNGQVMLIDGGRSISLANSLIIPQIKAWGASQVDVLVVTHPDADHIGGLVGVLENFPVKLVALTGDEHPTDIYTRLLNNVSSKNISALEVRTGTAIPFDSAVKLEVLGPDDALVNQDNTNDGSIVIKLTYGQTSFLLTGDAEFAENQTILRSGTDVRATVLKLGHHGSSSSTDENWLRAVQPQLGVISAGAGNPYGHPHVEVVAALNNLGIQYIRTDEHGTISITSDGTQLRVTSQR